MYNYIFFFFCTLQFANQFSLKYYYFGTLNVYTYIYKKKKQQKQLRELKLVLGLSFFPQHPLSITSIVLWEACKITVSFYGTSIRLGNGQCTVDVLVLMNFFPPSFSPRHHRQHLRDRPLHYTGGDRFLTYLTLNSHPVVARVLYYRVVQY